MTVVDNSERLSRLARDYCGWVDATATLFVMSREDEYLAASKPEPCRIRFNIGPNSTLIDLESSFYLETTIGGRKPVIQLHLTHNSEHIASIPISVIYIGQGAKVHIGLGNER